MAYLSKRRQNRKTRRVRRNRSIKRRGKKYLGGVTDGDNELTSISDQLKKEEEIKKIKEQIKNLEDDNITIQKKADKAMSKSYWQELWRLHSLERKNIEKIIKLEAELHELQKI
jgi:hypothetical protein